MISRRFGCRYYGAEPHPLSYSRIRQSDLVSVLACAIAPVDAPVRLHVSTYSESHSLRPLPRSGVGSIEVDGITFQTVYGDLPYIANKFDKSRYRGFRGRTSPNPAQ